MKKALLTFLLTISCTYFSTAQEEVDSLAVFFQQIESSMQYQTGKIEFKNENADIDIPKGYKFLDGEQTQYVLTDLWGNIRDTTVLGAILPEKLGVTNENSWMFVISYHNIGYVKDDDANDIDYDELLEELQKDFESENVEREKLGYEKAHLVGWASKPYYDNTAKVLHWAKEIKFDDSETNTLNYDLRVLGRKGMFNLSAVSGINQLDEVKKSIPLITKSVTYKEGSRYSDFDSGTDNVAAWTIGGLVAGKLLAKTGFFAILAKFGKVIIVGLLGLLGALRKFIFGSKEQEVTKEESIVSTDNSDPKETEN